MQATANGDFRYTATFTADMPIEVAGAGFGGIENVDPQEMHGDGFCMSGLAAGESSPVDVAGSLKDVTRLGVVDAWFAPCNEPTLVARTRIVPPDGPYRFAIVGHPPLSEVRVGPLSASRNGATAAGSGVLVAVGVPDVPLVVRLQRRAGAFLYRMRSVGRRRPRAKAILAVAADVQTVERVRITLRLKHRKAIAVRDAANIVLIPRTDP